MTPEFTTDKIGFATFILLRNKRLLRVVVKRAKWASFTFAISLEEAGALELEYTQSDYSRYFETFKYLRSRVNQGVKP
jgi:hypothetical protein